MDNNVSWLAEKSSCLPDLCREAVRDGLYFQIQVIFPPMASAHSECLKEREIQMCVLFELNTESECLLQFKLSLTKSKLESIILEIE